MKTLSGNVTSHFQRGQQAITSDSFRTLLAFGGIYLIYFSSAYALAAFYPTVAALLRTLITLGAIYAAERWLLGRPTRLALGRLGLGWPRPRAMFVALAAGAPLLAFYPVYSTLTGVTFTLPDGWLWLYLSYVAVSALSEEVMFRAFLYGNLRSGRSFRRAASLAMLAFAAVHLFLLARLSLPLVAAATLLAAAGAYPLAALYERAGRSVWPGALLHALVHTISVVSVTGGDLSAPLAFMALAAVSPWLVFVLGARDFSWQR